MQISSNQSNNLSLYHNILPAKDDRIEQPPLDFLDDKLFAHEVFDFGANKSSFEGANYSQTIPRLLNVIKSLPKDITKSILSSLPLFEECAKLTVNLYAITNRKDPLESLKEFSNSLSSEIQRMPIGSRKLIPGGWSDAYHPAGHAILYCIEKINGNKYKFTLFNTGAGVNFHASAIDAKPQNRYQTFLSITDISADKFNPQFIQALLEPQILPEIYYELPENFFDSHPSYDEHYIYNNLLNSLEGKREAQLNPSTYGFLYSKPQRAGTCAMKSLFAAMRFFYIENADKKPESLKLALNQYKKFKFAYYRHSLLQKCSSFFEEQTPWSRSSHKLISQAKAHFARLALSLHARNLISEADLKACQATCADIEIHLAAKKKANKQEDKPIKLSSKLLTSNGVSLSHNQPFKEISIDQSSTSYSTERLSDFFPIPQTTDVITPENVAIHLQKLANLNFEEVPKDLRPGIHGLMIEAVRKLPIPTATNDPFWNTVPEKEIEICLDCLSKFSRMGIWPSLHNQANTSPSIFIEMNTILAIAWILCQRQPENKLKDFTLPSHQLIRFYQSPKTIFYNPLDQKRLDELMNFFAPQFDSRNEIPLQSLQNNPSKQLFSFPVISFSSTTYLKTSIPITSQTVHEFQEFKYYFQFWNSPEIKKIITQNKLAYEPLEKQMQFICSVAKLSNPLFPKNVLYLRNIAHAIQISDRFHEFYPTTSLSEELAYEVEDKNLKLHSYFQNKSAMIGYSLFYSNNLNEIQEKLANTDQNTFMSTLADEEERDQKILQTNSHDEIVRYLAYLETQPDSSLETKDNQELMLYHFFRPGRLLRTINEEPETLEKIFSLLNRRLDYFMSVKKWKTALVLIDICNRCADYVRFAKNESPHKIPDLPLRNYREILNSILSTNIDENIRIHAVDILQGFIISQQNIDQKRYDECVIDWVSARIMQSFNLNETHFLADPLIDTKRMYDVLLENEIPNILDDASQKVRRNKILNESASHILGKAISLDWEGSYPRYQAGEILIDLQEGDIQTQDQFNGILPKPLRNLPQYSFLFSNIKDVNRHKIEEGLKQEHLYEIEDDHGITEVVVIKSNHAYQSLEIYRVMHGVRHKLILSNNFDLNPCVNLINSKALYWIAHEEEESSLIVENPKGKTYYGRMQKNENDYKLTSFSDQKSFNQILVDPRRTEIHRILSSFESREYEMAFWANKNQTNAISEIDLLDLNLHFYVSKDKLGKERFFSREATGFYISKDQLKQFANDWPNYLVLENEQGERKVIMRNLKNPCADPSTFDVNLKKEYTEDYTIFNIAQIASKIQLKATSEFDAIYLFKIHMATKHFHMALLDLKHAWPLSLYSDKEIQLISEIITNTPGGGHPSALSNILKMAILLEKNHLKYIPKNKNLTVSTANPTQKKKDSTELHFGNKILEIYDAYLSNIQNITDPLSLDEEKTLLRMFNRIENSLLTTSPLPAKRAALLFHPNSAKFESRPIIPIGLFPKLDPAEISETNVLKLLKDLISQEEVENPSLPLVFSILPSDFLGKFKGYYHLAKNGTEQQRMALKNALKLLWKSSTDNSCRLLSIIGSPPRQFPKDLSCLLLIAVCESPRQFPELDKLKQALDSKKGTLFAKAIQNSKFYKEMLASTKKYGFSRNAFVNSVPGEEKQTQKTIEELSNEWPKISPANLPFSIMPLPKKTGLDNRCSKVLNDFKKKFLTPDADISQMRKSLAKSLKNSQHQLNGQEVAICSLLNEIKPNSTPVEALQKHGRIEKKKLTFETAISLFEKGDLSHYRQITSLSDTQIMDLEQKICRHLIASTRIAQFKRVLSLLEERETSVEKKPLDEKILAELDSVRNYTFTQGEEALKRSALVFEYRFDILLRKKQVDTLDSIVNLKKNLDLLVELGTGSGKSKVLAPLFQRLRGALGNPVFNIWPSPLYEVNKRDMKTQALKAFGQKADTFEFNRGTSVEKENLLIILRELTDFLIEGKQMNATPESLQACELKFLETLYKLAHEERAVPLQAIPLLQEILKFLYSSEIHIDESHINLSPRREVNFTVGPPKSEPMENVQLMETLFDFLISDKQSSRILGLRNNRQRLATPKTYVSQIAPRLARNFIPYFKIPKEDQQIFIDYVLGLKTDKEWLEKQPQSKQIILLRELISFLLPEILQKKVNVNYGLSKLVNGTEYAKPYNGNDSPVENADYDNIYETFSKTYLTYFHQGLSLEQLWKFVQHLQFESLKSAREQMIDPRQSETYKFYLDHFPNMGELFALTKNDIEGFESELKHKKSLIYYYIRNIIAPTIKKYEFKLKSTSANLKAMCQSHLGMTATPGNKEIYSDGIELKKDVGNEKLILNKIAKTCAKPESLHLLKSSDPKNVLQKIKKIFASNPSFTMLIDIGALLTGIDNLTVAQALLEHCSQYNPHIRGVVFFDKDDRMMVLLKDQPHPIPYEQCGLGLHERLTYCDQRHSFGADIPQFHTAKALCTFDKLTDKDGLVQGVGRMRQFMQNQTVEWAFTEDFKEAIKPKGDLTINDLLDFAEHNQIEREKEDLKRALKHQMSNEIRIVLMKKLMNCPDEKILVELFKDFEQILVEKVDSLNGEHVETKLTVETLQKYRLHLEQKVDQLTKLTTIEKNHIKQNLNKYDTRINRLEKMLPVYSITRNTNLETEVEMQQNVNVDTETNVQQLSINNSDLYLRTPTLWPKNFNFYENNWMKPQSAKQTLISKTFQVIKTKANVLRNSAILSVCSVMVLKVMDVAIPHMMAIAAGVVGGVILVAYSVHYLVKSFKLFGKPEFEGHLMPRGKSNMILYDAGDLLRENKNPIVSKAHKYFLKSQEGQILFTNNFVARSCTWNEIPINPLSKEQKSAYQVLVVQDELEMGKKKWTVIVGDQSTDAKFWREELQFDCLRTTPEIAAERKRKICLYDLNLQLVKNGALPFDEAKELTDNKEFQSLITKVKLFNADTFYTTTQQQCLTSLANTDESFTALKNFYQTAQTWHNKKQKLYPSSWIAQYWGSAPNPAKGF